MAVTEMFVYVKDTNMKKIIACSLIAFTLMGCSNASRTVPVLVMDERTISGDVPRDNLVIPPDYRNPKLNPPREDTVLRDYQKNNFLTPPRRPCSISNTPGCVK
jgi:hypothetical protein